MESAFSYTELGNSLKRSFGSEFKKITKYEKSKKHKRRQSIIYGYVPFEKPEINLLSIAKAAYDKVYIENVQRRRNHNLGIALTSSFGHRLLSLLYFRYNITEYASKAKREYNIALNIFKKRYNIYNFDYRSLPLFAVTLEFFDIRKSCSDVLGLNYLTIINSNHLNSSNHESKFISRHLSMVR